MFSIFFKISIYISSHNTKLSITVFKFYVYLNAAHLQIQKRMTQKKRENKNEKRILQIECMMNYAFLFSLLGYMKMIWRCMWLAKRSLVVVVVVNTVSLCSTFTFSHLMFIFFAFLASLQAVKISRLCP